MQAATADLFSNRVKTRARLASQTTGSIAISLVRASREQLRRCTCDPNSVLRQTSHPLWATAASYEMTLHYVTCNVPHYSTLDFATSRYAMYIT